MHTSRKAVINDKPAMRMQRISSGKVRRAKRKQVMSDKGLWSVCIFTEEGQWSGHSRERKHTSESRKGREGQEDYELCVGLAGEAGQRRKGRITEGLVTAPWNPTASCSRLCVPLNAEGSSTPAVQQIPEEERRARRKQPPPHTHPCSQRHQSRQLKGESNPTVHR